MDRSELQIVLSAKDEVTKELQKVSSELKRLSASVNSGSNSFGKGMANMRSEANKTEGSVKTLIGTMQGLGALRLFQAIGAFYALRVSVQALSVAVGKAATFEKLEAGLAAVTAEAGSITPQLERLREVAKLPGLGFEEAIRGSTNLQAAGLSAGLAERALKSFGNALATVGKGKTELDGVITALTQIVSKGKVSAEEILQLSERLPQIRVAMKDAFGTSNTEELAKMGIDAEMFVNGIIEQFEKLPPVTGGFALSLENLGQDFADLQANIGSTLIPTLTPLIESFSMMLQQANDNADAYEYWAKVIYSFTNLMIGLVKVTSFVGVAFYALYKGTRVVFEGIGNIIGALLVDVTNLGRALMKLITGDFEEAWEIASGGSAMSTAFDMIVDNASTSFDEVKELASKVADEVALSFDRAVNFEGFNFKKALSGAGTVADLSTKPAGDDGKAAEKMQKELEAVLKVIEKFNTGMERFKDQFKKAKEVASESIQNIKENTKSNLASIKQELNAVGVKVSELYSKFNELAQGNKNDLAQKFIDAENRVKSLKDELARATDVQAIFDIKTKIKEEEQALEKTKDVRAQFADEIAKASEMNNLSALEQEIALFNQKQAQATTELQLELAKLETEKSALRDKRALEKELSLERIAEVREEREAKIREIEEEKKAFIKSTLDEMLLENNKGEVIKRLMEQVQIFRQSVTETASKGIQNTVTNEIKLYNELARAIQKAADARASSGISKGNRDTGGSIQQTGMYRLHQGETVLTKRESQGGYGGGVTVSITGGTYLSQDAAEQMGNLLLDKLKAQVRV